MFYMLHIYYICVIIIIIITIIIRCLYIFPDLAMRIGCTLPAVAASRCLAATEM